VNMLVKLPDVGMPRDDELYIVRTHRFGNSELKVDG